MNGLRSGKPKNESGKSRRNGVEPDNQNSKKAGFSLPTHLKRAPDGARIATTSKDRTVRIWNISPEGSREFRTIENGAAVYDLALSPDGGQLAASGADGKVRIWHDRNAVDTPVAQARYRSHFYRMNQRLSGVGYNLFNLGGL